MPSYNENVLMDNPAGFWPMDEPSGTIRDLSGNGRHWSSIVGTLDYSQGGPRPEVRNSIKFDHGEYATQAVFQTAQDNFTVEAFVKPTAFSGGVYRWLYALGDPTATNGWSFGINASTAKMAGVAHNVGLTSDGATTLVVGTWYHLVWQRSATVWRFFINGELDSPNVATFTPGIPSGTAGLNMVITDGTAGLDAYVAGMAVYNTALDPARIRAHWASAYTVISQQPHIAAHGVW